MTTNSKRVRTVCVAIAACVLFAGCGKTGPRNCRISGELTLDGKPVRDGAIQFDITKDGDVPGGAVVIDGRYQTWISPGSKTVRFAIAGSRDGLAPEDETPNICPPKYAKSPPQIEVLKSGVHDFRLTSN